MMKLSKIFNNRECAMMESPERAVLPNAGPRVPGALRTSAAIRGELERARGALQVLDQLLVEADCEQETARQAYDAGIAAFAAGEASREPERGDLEAATTKADAMRRVRNEKRHDVENLNSELNEAARAEAIVADTEALPVLIAAAESAVADLETAVELFLRDQAIAFAALFSEADGLKRPMATEGLRADVRRARHALKIRAQQALEKLRIDPDFETDGELNLGARERGGVLVFCVRKVPLHAEQKAAAPIRFAGPR